MLPGSAPAQPAQPPVMTCKLHGSAVHTPHEPGANTHVKVVPAALAADRGAA